MKAITSISIFRAILFITFLFLTAFVRGAETHAATITVDRTDDAAAASACTAAGSDCSLRGAVAFANANSGTVITVPANTYLLTAGELVLGNATNILTTINGAGPGTTTIQQNTINSRVIDLNPSLSANVVVNISGVRITGGNSPSDAFGGGGLIGGGAGNHLNISNCLFENNSDVNALTAKGGGIEWAGGGFLNIDNCTFNNNTAGGGALLKGVGGGVDYQLLNLAGAAGQGGLTITNSTFTGNKAGAQNAGAGGGLAMAVTTTQSPRTITVTNNTFTGNQANATTNGHGGAITSSSADPLTIKFNRIVDNTATGLATGLYQSLGTTGTIDATENWWGCNQGPTNAACDTIGGLTANIDADPRIVLSHTPATSPIVRGQASTLTASFLRDSNNAVLTAANVSRLIGLPITFGSAVRGTLSAAQGTIQASGTATATFTATATGAGSAIATVDSHQVTAAITIQKGNTTISLSSAPAATVTGQSYTVSFNAPQPVSPATGTPSGTVTVSDGSHTCQATLPATSCSLTSTTAGAKNLTATYNGDTDYNASPVSAVLPHTVNPAGTTAGIGNINPTPSVFGQSYAVSAGVSVNAPGGGTPAGTINVSDGTNSCAITLPALSCSLPSTLAGPLTISATYAGTSDYNASPAATLGHTVNRADTTTTIISSAPNPSTAGQNFVVSYSVGVNAPGAGTPLGNVTISDGISSCIGTVADGQCTMSLPANGTYNLTASYSGSTNFEGGDSAIFVHQVCAGAAIVVANTADSGAGSLRDALSGVCPGGQITFTPDFNLPQTITLAGEIAISKDITINGPGAQLLTIDANAAGRALNISGGNVALSNMKITGGNAANGGGIANLGGTLTLTNVVVAGNSVTDLGGGIYSTSAVKIVGSTVSGNTANSLTGATGGGIHCTGPLTIINSTVSGNSVPNGDGSGGGIRVEGATSITNATISNNSAAGPASASGLFRASGLVTLRNTIVAANQGNTATADTLGAFDPASAYNLIGNVGAATGFTAANQNQTGTGASPLNPLLDVLGTNGGTTPNHRLLPGSPAMDKGSAADISLAPLTIDQRGMPRPIDHAVAPNAPGGDGSDIGSYEFQVPTAAQVSVSGRVLTSAGLPLRNAVVTLTDSGGNTRTAITSSLGFYVFENVPVGSSILEASAKRHRFDPALVTITDPITDMDLWAREE